MSSLPEGQDLSFKKIKNVILPKLKSANVTRVTLIGGEPNKYSSMEEYLEICKFAKKYNANYVLFNPLSKFGRGEYTQNLAYTQKDLIELRKNIEKEDLEDDKFQIVFIRIPRENSKENLSECNCEIAYIFTNGDVAVCPY